MPEEILKELATLFPEPLTMNDIRHSYVTNARKGDRSKADVEAIAHNLGHSLSMNYDYRRE